MAKFHRPIFNHSELTVQTDKQA